MESLDGGDEEEKARLVALATRLQATWRKCQAERHVDLIRVVFSEARRRAATRGAMSNEGDEVQDIAGWRRIRDAVCGDIVQATKSCSKARNMVDFLQAGAARTARMRRLRERLHAKYLMEQALHEATQAAHQQVEETSQLWQNLYSYAKGTDRDTFEFDDDQLERVDEAARRIQQAWTTFLIRRAETKAAEADAAASVLAATAEAANLDDDGNAFGASQSRSEATHRNKHLRDLRRRKERLAGLKMVEARAAAAAALHVARLNGRPTAAAKHVAADSLAAAAAASTARASVSEVPAEAFEGYGGSAPLASPAIGAQFAPPAPKDAAPPSPMSLESVAPPLLDEAELLGEQDMTNTALPPPPAPPSGIEAPLPDDSQALLSEGVDATMPPPPAPFQGYAAPPIPMAAETPLFEDQIVDLSEGDIPSIAALDDVRRSSIESFSSMQGNSMSKPPGPPTRSHAGPMPVAPNGSPGGSHVSHGLRKGIAAPKSARLPPLAVGEQSHGLQVGGAIAPPTQGSQSARSAPSHRSTHRSVTNGAASFSGGAGGDSSWQPPAPALSMHAPKAPTAPHATPAGSNRSNRPMQLPQLSVQARGNHRSAQAPPSSKMTPRPPPSLMV